MILSAIMASSSHNDRLMRYLPKRKTKPSKIRNPANIWSQGAWSKCCLNDFMFKIFVKIGYGRNQEENFPVFNLYINNSPSINFTWQRIANIRRLEQALHLMPSISFFLILPRNFTFPIYQPKNCCDKSERSSHTKIYYKVWTRFHSSLKKLVFNLRPSLLPPKLNFHLINNSPSNLLNPVIP